LDHTIICPDRTVVRVPGDVHGCTSVAENMDGPVVIKNGSGLPAVDSTVR